MTANRPRLGFLLLVLAACQQPLAPDGAGSALATSGARVSCQAPPEGIIAWWHGEGDGSDAVGANPATAVGSVGYAPGHQGLAFALAGSGYLEVPDAATLDLASSFTLDFWYQPNSVDTPWFEGLIGKRDVVTGLTNLGVSFNPTFLGLGPYYNDPDALGGDDYDMVGSPFEAIRVSPTPAAGVFHHFAAVYRQATATQVELRMFVDGAMVRARTIDGDLARTVNDAPLTLGASAPWFEMFNGVLDEVRIFDRALTDAEVGGLLAASQPSCASLSVAIDVLPGDPANRLPCGNPRALVTVAVLSSATFDATLLDPGSARFGPSEAAEVHRDSQGIAQRHLEDVNGDGLRDLVLHFRFGETGLGCQSTEAGLTISDAEGAEYQGTDALTPGGH
ncbi:MAG TPA: LamG domain-containing protein [Gemmatimonadales bacterium]